MASRVRPTHSCWDVSAEEANKAKMTLNLPHPFNQDCRTTTASGTTVGGLAPGRVKRG